MQVCTGFQEQFNEFSSFHHKQWRREFITKPFVSQAYCKACTISVQLHSKHAKKKWSSVIITSTEEIIWDSYLLLVVEYDIASNAEDCSSQEICHEVARGLRLQLLILICEALCLLVDLNISFLSLVSLCSLTFLGFLSLVALSTVL